MGTQDPAQSPAGFDATAVVAELSMDDFPDGIIYSLPANTPDSATFVTSFPNSDVMFGSGFTVRFIGSQFTHTHPKVVEVLRKCAKRGSSIVEVAKEAVATGEVPTPVDPTKIVK